jgi:hypothetical protein
VRASALLALLLLVLGCAGEEADTGRRWASCSLTGPREASGLAIWRGDLLFVCGGGDRNVYAISIDELAPQVSPRVRTLTVERDDAAPLMGQEEFATHGYQIGHLWKQDPDFQALAVQAPNFVYVGDRARRVAYWGLLTADAAGRADRIRLRGAFIVPGAKRTETSRGDWRDHGPGLSGFATSGGQRTEDLYAVDRGAPGGSLRIHRLGRYGSVLGAIRVRHGLDGSSDIGALAVRARGFLLARASGSLVQVPYPRRDETVGMTPAALDVPLPAGTVVTGMTRDARYLVLAGEPPVLTWRAGAAK